MKVKIPLKNIAKRRYADEKYYIATLDQINDKDWNEECDEVDSYNELIEKYGADRQVVNWFHEDGFVIIVK